MLHFANIYPMKSEYSRNAKGVFSMFHVKHFRRNPDIIRQLRRSTNSTLTSDGETPGMREA